MFSSRRRQKNIEERPTTYFSSVFFNMKIIYLLRYLIVEKLQQNFYFDVHSFASIQIQKHWVKKRFKRAKQQKNDLVHAALADVFDRTGILYLLFWKLHVDSLFFMLLKCKFDCNTLISFYIALYLSSSEFSNSSLVMDISYEFWFTCLVQMFCLK